MDTAEIRLKVVAVGNIHCGKTSILYSLANDYFLENITSTIGVQQFSRSITHNGKNIHMSLVDTAGQEKYKAINSIFYRNSNIVLLVFDQNDSKSFQDLPKWLKSLKEVCSEDVLIILVGTKYDLTQVIDENEIWEFKKANSLKSYLKVSPKTGKNMNRLLDKIIGNIDNLKVPENISLIKKKARKKDVCNC